MSFAIYDLNEDLRKLLTLENFLNGLTSIDFIEELSKDHFFKAAEVKNLDNLDPKPFIRTFESTLRHLKQLADDANEQKERAVRDVEEFELSHSKNVLKLSSEVAEAVSKFDALDNSILTISDRMDPLNQTLNKISNSRDRSTDTIFLTRAYHGFYTKEQYDPLESMRVSKDPELKMKCAKTVKSLLILARKIEQRMSNIPKVAKCVNSIQKYGEVMEQALVDRFEIASEDNDFDEMSVIVDILFEFNGGSSVVLAFMNKSDLFFNDTLEDGDDQAYSLLEDEQIWERLADKNSKVFDIFHGEVTEDLLNKLKVSVKGQARIIQQVFKQLTPVLKVMIQRLYAQTLQNKTLTLLLFSQRAGNLAHLRVLNALYVLIGEFTSDVKDFFVTNDLDETNEIGLVLDQCYNDLFIDYLSDNRSFQLEKESLENVIFEIAQDFISKNERALARKDLENRLQEIENETANLDMSSVGNTQLPQEKKIFFVDKRRLNKFKDFVKVKIPEKLSINGEREDYIPQEQKFLSLTDVSTVLRMAIESMSRVLELSPLHALDCALEILEILIFDLGGLYVGGALEVAYDNAKQEQANALASTEPQFAYIKVFKLTQEVLVVLSSCVQKIILPCTVNNRPVRNRIISLTNNFVLRCETSLNLIMEAIVETTNDRLVYLLQKQKKKDFLWDSIDDVADYTEVCESISDYLIQIQSLLKKQFSDANYTKVLIKFGIMTLNLLMDHFKNFSVNSTGGIVLTQDVIRYQSVIDSWEIPELSEKFQILREVSNLFTVQPNLINSLITEGHLASLKIATVKQYISKRTDLSPSYMERFFGRK